MIRLPYIIYIIHHSFQALPMHTCPGGCLIYSLQMSYCEPHGSELYTLSYKCLRHLKGIKLKYQNKWHVVYQKACLSLLPAVGIEPRPLEWEEDTLLGLSTIETQLPEVAAGQGLTYFRDAIFPSFSGFPDFFQSSINFKYTF